MATWVLLTYSRLGAGLYIHDSEFSDLFLTEPFLRKRTNTLIADNDLWMAPTARDWSKAFQRSLDPPPIERTLKPDSFRGYIILEGVLAEINDIRGSGHWLAREPLQAFLIQFYEEYFRQLDHFTDTLCLQALWHGTFLALLVDFDRLELAVGREGFQGAQSQLEYMHSWVKSPNSRRCAAHAVMALRAMETLPLGTQPAIHVPRVLYRATLTWYCFIKFSSSVEVEDHTRRHQPDEFPEFAKMGVDLDKLLFEAYGFNRARPKTLDSSTLCQFVDLLGRIGHWGLARKLASMCEVLINPASDEGPIDGG